MRETLAMQHIVAAPVFSQELEKQGRYTAHSTRVEMLDCAQISSIVQLPHQCSAVHSLWASTEAPFLAL